MMIQNQNAARLQKKFDDENVPMFIQRFFIMLDSKAGAVNYWIVIRNLIIWLIDKKIINKVKISDIVPDDFCYIDAVDIKEYLDSEMNRGIKESTLITRKRIFASFWGYMVNSPKYPIDKNIICEIKYKKDANRGLESNLVKKLPSNEQLEMMEQNIINRKEAFIKDRDLCVYHMLKGSGMREGELAGLDLEDLYIEKEIYSKYNEKIPFVLIIGKGVYSKDKARKVRLTGSAVSVLRNWLSYREKLDVEEKNALFVNKKGNRLTEKNIQNIFKVYSKGTITPHMMRHWFATVIANKGNVIYAQQELGHLSDKTTIDNYIDSSYGMEEIFANM